MNNQEIAKIFHEIAVLLEIEDVAFKPQAYEKAAMGLEALSEDVEKIYKRGGIKELEELPGVGKGIAEKIIEYLKTGKIKEYQQLKKKTPVDIEELTAVEGIGPKTISILYKVLSIKNLKDLERAARAGKIRRLENFGEKSEQNILESIEFLKRSKGRFLLGEILPEVREIYKKLKNLKEVKKISLAGSLRRMKETIGDIDFLVVSRQPEKVMNFFISLPGVIKIWGKGATKTSVRMRQGYDMDIRVVAGKSFGSALQYFTGSKEHNIATRKLAMEKGFKLNEYGIKTEEEVYKKIGLPYIEPELRENTGELEAGLRGKLPKIIGYQDICGDLHCHSHWGADKNKAIKQIENFVRLAREMNYEYVGISDHTKFLAIEHGLDEKQLLEQKKFIDKLNQKLKIENCKLKILCGCEANIMADGSIDINDKTLAKLDYVIAGVHSQFKMNREKMTERIIRAMRNPNVDIISHLTGRIIQQRDEYEIDFDKILKAAKETGTILEINAYPVRLDLKDSNIRKAKEAGVKMVINTDSHQSEQMRFMEYGISQARRGWAEKKDIINCWSAEKMLGMLK
ncbi:MAG: DNA polymerase/3'-5' exonuclease PolX [Candidatus Terrybacteria bacterium]|nr:DNA polymerase/3'-5' exonuclease PolX [Candidatus Terrybacteria bacterium]